MCNFVVRPIKSYATVDIVTVNIGGEVVEMERGEYLDVHYATQDGVFGLVNGDENRELTVPYKVFTHTFTANPVDVKRVKDAEASWFNSKDTKAAKEAK